MRMPAALAEVTSEVALPIRLKDISLLAADGKSLRMIVQAGEIVENDLR